MYSTYFLLVVDKVMPSVGVSYLIATGGFLFVSSAA